MNILNNILGALRGQGGSGGQGGIGDLLGFPKGPLTNFVIRRVRKMVPPYSLPGSLRFSEVLARHFAARRRGPRAGRARARTGGGAA